MTKIFLIKHMKYAITLINASFLIFINLIVLVLSQIYQVTNDFGIGISLLGLVIWFLFDMFYLIKLYNYIVDGTEIDKIRIHETILTIYRSFNKKL